MIEVIGLIGIACLVGALWIICKVLRGDADYLPDTWDNRRDE